MSEQQRDAEPVASVEVVYEIHHDGFGCDWQVRVKLADTTAECRLAISNKRQRRLRERCFRRRGLSPAAGSGRVARADNESATGRFRVSAHCAPYGKEG